MAGRNLPLEAPLRPRYVGAADVAEWKVMVVFALIVINKAGGLIYHREFHEGLNKLSVNDYLVLAGTFHGVHAITKNLCPLPRTPGQPPTGIEVLESESFRLQCFQTLTGTKFLLFTEPHQPNIDGIIRKVYELYSDYVMKNPFYQIEMPIRCDAFDRHLASYIKPRQ
ncbi:Sybindin-like protein [Xylona heveae TC161]|uniref:Trafficking protein particle complex subunit n=1 Tax=Xylona heveae (strain CBS 132557 / TC161) TaxID=1328760 RepID=A0A165HMX3_XYLHT|nr:Sybindin-like protein [Xylona heveae TC161]KZF23751.1 Sybindin-like protein [Xylona heveae TC161]